MSRTPPSASARGQRRPVFSLVVALLIVIVGVVQLLATVNTYAANVSELNALKEQQATLIAQKENLENNIKRWDDKAYVVSQARDRLGFVFPGETSVMVLNSEGLTDGSSNEAHSSEASSDGQTLPWYKELQYSFQQADAQKNVSGEKFQNETE